MCVLVFNLVQKVCELIKYDVVWDADRPYWDRASLNNIKLKFISHFLIKYIGEPRDIRTMAKFESENSA